MSKKQTIENHTGKLLNDYTPEQRREIARKANEISQQKKRTKKAAKEILLDLLASNSTDKNTADIVVGKGVEGTELATLLYNMTKKASKSANMAELIFKLTGDLQETPQQNITIVNQLTDEQLINQIQQLRGAGEVIDITPKPPELDG